MSCFAGTVAAQDGLSCHFGYEDQFLPFTAADSEQSEIDVKAEDVQLLQNGTSVFSGHVDVTRAGQQLSSQRATYNRNTGDVTASGDVRLRDSEMIIDAERAEWSLSDDKGRMLNAEYRVRQMHARGEASHVLRRGKTNTDMKNATYTTCPEGDNAWKLKANTVHLDHEKAVGEAKHVVLRLGGLPVFYTPYINFPLNDERKSGFLVPSIGSSDETGFDLSTPYYWNIAPNLDATITPRYMADRGLMLNGQFRYLFESGEGEVEASFLDSDDLKKDGDDINPHFQEDRELFSWQHLSRFDNRWRARVDYNYVSDNNYFEDFGSSLNLSSQTHLNRLVETGYIGNNWNFTARLQGYQTLADDIAEPYKRLPQLLLRGFLPDQALGLTYELDAEYVEFDHDDKVEGQRIDFEPAISLPMGTSAFFATPRVALNHTRYNLTNDTNNRFDDSATRTLPVTSFDTGVFFERELSFGDGNYIQTIEPRAFYLYIPRRDQSDIPDFDTSLSTFNMIRLFSYDRFIGRDRVGDANQLSLAVTSRLLDEETGEENLRLTVGQIQYFTDREVTLPNGRVDNRSDSDMIAEAVAYISDTWSVSGEIQWDPNDDMSNMSSVGLRYRGGEGRIFNISHRYRRDDITTNTLEGLEHIDVSAQMPVGDRWSVFGRWYRAIDQGRTLEGLAGVEYNSCCWATRLAVRNYVNDADDDDRNMSIYLQVELKGLGSFGKKSDSLLQRSIRGYETD
ncbi:LPS-assembly protein LptD [Methylophaga sp. OBS4]|uniref:LPS-assembly protein LptD n=1 Tax=Methylophaga sp. OBS4 TaxID=2991935 RepID=UPI00225588C0|nr:LPS-assembly protein LptD [Methylophaga sp. OBS4]MCX4188562.1 LPS-assembly protein LptD [Methylophaga sp. OBS4]